MTNTPKPPEGAASFRATLRIEGIEQEFGFRVEAVPHVPLKRCLREAFDSFLASIPSTPLRNTDD